jgi:6-phosphogluconolactonase
MSTYFRPLVIVAVLSTISFLPACGSKNQVACDCINPGASSYLYASVADSTVSFKLESNGVPTVFASQAGPNDSGGILVDSSSKFLYISDFSNGEIDAFTINKSTGTLSEVSGSPFSTGPAPGGGGIAIDPQTRFLYVLNSSGVLGYTINSSTGALTAIAGSPFPGSSALDAIVNPTGKFLYASNNGDSMGTIAAYSIDSTTGALSSVAGSPFVTQANFPGPAGFAFGAAGKFLYVGMAGSANANNVVTGFSVDSTTGALTQIAGSPFTAGKDPGHIATDPNGKFLFTANSQDNTVSAFTIDVNSGALTQVSGSPFPSGGGPVSVTVDPTGAFVYVGMQPSPIAGTQGLSAFSLNRNSGALTPLTGSPFATDKFFFGVAITKP